MSVQSGRNGPRSKSGCSTCRRRKVKCGEEKPVCGRCSALRLNCEWGVPVKRGRSTQIRHLEPAPSAPEQWPLPEFEDLVDTQQDLLYTSLSPVSWAGDFVPFDTTQLTSFRSTPIATPIYPSLNFNNVACANSLALNALDLQYFQYFPSSSLVYYYMKGWKWSSFCHLYQGPAASNKVIMRMILALSACDMHRNGLVVRSPGRPTADDHGRYHYSLAVKEFRQLLETPRQVSLGEVETVFATVFLMIAWEWQFGHSVRHLQLHLQGVRSLLETHPQLFRIKDVNDMLLSPGSGGLSDEPGTVAKMSFIPEQFLLWILYIDSSCRPMGLTESLNDYVAQSGNPALQPDHLHRCARLWGRCFWGEQYPDEEVLDDIENYRALELLHDGFCLRHRTWKSLVDSAAGTADSADVIFREILTIREKFSDLFVTARFAAGVSARRTVNTIYMAVSTFYAQVILHRRLLCVDTLPAAIHQQATAGIVDIAQKQFISDPNLLRRLHWPLLMAVIETSDPTQQAWLRQRLWELREFHSEYVWAHGVAEQILAQQDVSQGRYVNLAELLLQRFHAQ
ncbi:hypothetical protein N7499_005404 [Penicillium canescens]|uniref:Zn(2)-C6 fungal-type domain-containing protein n=1 Tax=Penicillium canescens TaxID=5083 RepID=A0AAD6IJF0_PENCN|nr:uncharacterized protein N7446_010925 [Penicillium canescens]KAJ6029725.1 hypothetical protein N7444_012712 [Penicillium canescens]KAJ6048157.1 hypothetical protein N7460_004304 [Penicillium canescens]KAJ6048242.1 hypothetical protein N7446_010925 [Penicillium canescens]KAJ6085775.1 hypothetical protein N7499_005404 [Penicillium canescens]KAJ6162548.1 hypothetical protein N7485_010778 [Penicillium canescens]